MIRHEHEALPANDWPKCVRCTVPADVDALLAIGNADQATGDSTDSSSGVRRRLLQTPTVPGPTNSVLVYEWAPAKVLTTTPEVAKLGPTTLKQAELPRNVTLNIFMDSIGPNKPVKSDINNGTTNITVGVESTQTQRPKVFSYSLPRSYVVAPGNTTVYVSETRDACGVSCWGGMCAVTSHCRRNPAGSRCHISRPVTVCSCLCRRVQPCFELLCRTFTALCS